MNWGVGHAAAVPVHIPTSHPTTQHVATWRPPVKPIMAPESAHPWATYAQVTKPGQPCRDGQSRSPVCSLVGLGPRTTPPPPLLRCPHAHPHPQRPPQAPLPPRTMPRQPLAAGCCRLAPSSPPPPALLLLTLRPALVCVCVATAGRVDGVSRPQPLSRLGRLLPQQGRGEGHNDGKVDTTDTTAKGPVELRQLGLVELHAAGAEPRLPEERAIIVCTPPAGGRTENEKNCGPRATRMCSG